MGKEVEQTMYDPITFEGAMLEFVEVNWEAFLELAEQEFGLSEEDAEECMKGFYNKKKRG